MPTILVTGGAGFIGSSLVRMLIAGGRYSVVNLDKLTYAGNLDSLSDVLDDPRHAFVRGDIGDERLVGELLAQYTPVAIVNLAAESHVDRSIDSPAPFVETNVTGTFRLLDVAREYWSALDDKRRREFRFLHVSTDEVFGTLGDSGRFTETSPYAPNSPYAASKAAGDHFARAFFHTYGLPVIVTNSSNNYGPRQFPEKLIPLAILNALEGRPVPVYADGSNVRDWMHVDDHCRGLVAALTLGGPGETYNLGADSERTNLAIVETLCDLVDQLRPNLPHAPCRSLVKFVEDRPGHDRRYAIDSSKARRELNWQPQLDLGSGLHQTVQWYLDNAAWVDRVTTGVYRRERLGLSNRPRTETQESSR